VSAGSFEKIFYFIMLFHTAKFADCSKFSVQWLSFLKILPINKSFIIFLISLFIKS